MRTKSKEVMLTFCASSEQKAGDILENTTEHEGREGRKINFPFDFPATLLDNEIHKKINEFKQVYKKLILQEPLEHMRY